MHTFSVNKFYNKSTYYYGSKKPIGKIRTFLFSETKLLAVVIHRKDFLWMIKRCPIVVMWNNIKLMNNNTTIINKQECIKYKELLSRNTKLIHLKNTNCLLGYSVYFKNKSIGNVKNVYCNRENNNIEFLEITCGNIKGLLFGTINIKYKDIIKTNNSVLFIKDDTIVYEKNEGAVKKIGRLSSYLSYKIKENSSKMTNKIQENSDKIHSIWKEFKEEYNKGLNNK